MTKRDWLIAAIFFAGGAVLAILTVGFYQIEHLTGGAVAKLNRLTGSVELCRVRDARYDCRSSAEAKKEP